MTEPITFRATIPPIQTAINTGGDGMRIKLDIPEIDVPEAIALVAMRGKVLRVTVELETAENEPDQQRKTKQNHREIKF